MKLNFVFLVYVGLLSSLSLPAFVKSYSLQSVLDPHSVGSSSLNDINGDVFESSSSFEFIDQPLTTLKIVDPLFQEVESESLERQNNQMKEYLKGDGSRKKVSEKKQTLQTEKSFDTNLSKSPTQLMEKSSKEKKKLPIKGFHKNPVVKGQNILLTQDYEIEEVYWKDQNTRVRVMRPVYRSLSDPVSIAFFLVLAVILIGMIILVRETINKWMEKNFGASLDAILKDIITLYLIITILRILDYFDVFLNLEYYVNLRLVSVSFLVFSIFWLIMGVYSVLRCHSFVKGWNNLEKLFPKREQIFRQYENLYLETSGDKSQNRELEEKKQQLEYFLVRQEFVFPTFLPILSEAFLRDDFNFATYLAKFLQSLLTQCSNTPLSLF